MGCSKSRLEATQHVSLENLPEATSSQNNLPAPHTGKSRQLDRPEGIPHARPATRMDQPASSSLPRSRASVPSRHAAPSVSLPSDKILPKESKRYEIFTKVRIALQEGRNAFPETDRDRYQAYSDILGKLTQGDKSVIPKTNENIEAFIYRIAPPNMTRDQMHWDYPALSDLLPHALIPAFKREPTWTNKGRTDENWNGLTFGGETADCKHLSWVYCHPELIEAFVCELLSEPGKLSALLDKLPIDLANSFRSTVDRFQSGDNVKLKFLDLIAQSPLTMEAFFTSKAGSIKNITIAVNTMMALGPTHKRQTDDRNFGRLLGDVSELMRFHRKHDVHIFGATNTHALAARVQWKKDEKGAPKIRVTFYDPNLTGDHKIVEASTPKELHQHSLDDCFNPPLCQTSCRL